MPIYYINKKAIKCFFFETKKNMGVLKKESIGLLLAFT